MRVLLLLAAAAVCCPNEVEATVRIDYPGCNTRSCEKRMRARAHRTTIKRWRQVARPYRSWLRSTRACESGGRYRAISPDGRYTGAFQFDDQTWASVGGRGRAMHAEPAEQDFRAVRLLQRRGTAPWPVCG